MIPKIAFHRHFSKDKDLFNKIKNIFGFYPNNIFLYKLAFRHRSVSIEINSGVKVSNERLEYLGDAILGAIVAEYLFKKFPIKGEGFLTEMRSKFVSREQLNKLSKTLGLEELLQYSADSSHYSKSALGDTFEALVAAIYLDQGYNFCKSIIINNILLVYYDLDELISFQLNYKSKLLEWAQHNKKGVDFRLVNTALKDKNKQYKITVFIDNIEFASSVDYSIKGAEKNAALKTCKTLSEKGNMIFPEASPCIIGENKG